MSIAAVLFLIFLVLKLAGIIAWSWWLVTLPLWITLAIALVFAVLGAGFLSVANLVKRKTASPSYATRRPAGRYL